MLPSPAEELAQALAPTGLPLAQVGGDIAWAPLLKAVAAMSGLAVVRHDSLQAARAWSDRPAMQVLAPLYVEPVQFLVRDDSPWRWLHEMPTARVNLGPVDGARALAVRSAWQQLFSLPLAEPQADTGGPAEGLARLRARQVDVLAWVGAWPADFAAAGAMSGLRVLALDRSHASTPRLQQRFLLMPPASPGSAAGGDTGLALMSFLVAGPALPERAQRAVARRLCAALPQLRASGQPVWRAVQPVPALPTGWPAAPAAVDEFSQCVVAGSSPAARGSAQAATTRRPA